MVGPAGLHERAVGGEPTLRLVGRRPAAGQRVRCEEHLQAEHVLTGTRLHRRVERRRHVGEQDRPVGDATLPEEPVRVGQTGDRRAHRGRGHHRVDAELGHRARIALAVERQLVDDGVELGLVALLHRRPAPAIDHRPGGRGNRSEPRHERLTRVAGRHDDGREQLSAVDEAHAAHARTFDQDLRHGRPGAHDATVRLEHRLQRGRHCAAATHRSTDVGDVLHRVAQRAEPGARRVR